MLCSQPQKIYFPVTLLSKDLNTSRKEWGQARRLVIEKRPCSFQSVATLTNHEVVFVLLLPLGKCSPTFRVCHGTLACVLRTCANTGKAPHGPVYKRGHSYLGLSVQRED